MNMDFARDPKYHKSTKTQQNWNNRHCVVEQIFITARRFIVEPRKLGQTSCVA